MMKLSFINLFAYTILLTIVSTTLSIELKEKLSNLNQLFLNQGSTSNVLQEFDRVINEFQTIENEDKTLSQLYFKKSLIEINLNRESDAIQDLKTVLKLDSQMKPALKKLQDLLLSKGDMNDLASYVGNDVELKNKINHYNEAVKSALESYKNERYLDCTTSANKLLETSPRNYDLLELHYKCASNLYKTDQKMELQQGSDKVPINKVIISTLQSLINIQPLNNLQYYDQLSQYLLFTENQWTLSNKVVKNCLRVNNEYKKCGQLSKFYSKFQQFLSILEEYSITLGHYYSNLDSNKKLDDEFINPNFDFKYLNQFLFKDEIKVSKIEKNKLNNSIKNNFQYLIYQASQFAKNIVENDNLSILDQLNFVKDLELLACESFVQINDLKGSKAYCGKNIDQTFLPKSIPEIDRLIKKKNFQKAEQLLNQFNNNVKQSKLFTDRFKIIEEHHRKQNQQRQQQFFQQQQQQQQQQHQFRPPPQQQRKPTNDYYKILDIPRDADDKTIKKAYRTQTLKYHPDKYKGSDLTPEQIEKKMQEINQANEVLSDPELRERYDRGDDPNDPSGQSHPQRPNYGGQHAFNFGGSNGFDFSSFFNQHHKVKVKKNKKSRF